MRQHTATGAWSNSNIISAYSESIAYDANGNILKYLRHGANVSGAPLDMDSLNYQYNRDAQGNLLNNRLNYVKDNVSSTNYTVDIDNQAANNYLYDRIGNLKKDVAESIDNINWTVYGKIKAIAKTGGFSITYGYDAAGNRTSKTVTNSPLGDGGTFYIRDAQGNTLAIYSKKNTNPLHWDEQHLYGSSRLGIWQWDTIVPAAPPIVLNNTPIYDSLPIGMRTYELSNHLGNVLATISDKQIGSDSSGVVNYYIAEALTQTDYYPGGMQMPGREYSNNGADYRYGFNGKEMDNKDGVIQYDYGFRIYDPRLVRFKSVDPLIQKFPELTPYQFASNNPIEGIDLDGLEYVTYRIKIVDGKMVGKTLVKDYRDIKQVSEEQLNIIHKKRLTFSRSVNYGDRGGRPTRENYTKNFFNVFSTGFGPMGRGVLYLYEEYNSQTNANTYSSAFFNKEASQAPKLLEPVLGRVGVHGIYYGPGCPTINGGDHNFESNAYDYSLDPIDEVDGIAKQHDMDYEEVYMKTKKYDGWYDDINTIEADKKMIAGWEDYLKRAKKKGFKDKYTNKPASEEAINAAEQGIFYFKNIVIPHKESLKNGKDRVKRIQAQQNKSTGRTTSP